MSTALVIAGCCGRMGQRIASLALADGQFTIAGALEAPGHPQVGSDLGTILGQAALQVRVTDQPGSALAPGRVLIDFTRPEATVEHVRAARAAKVAMVIGTTGLTDAQRSAIREAATQIPIVFSPNMSVGVNLLFELVQTAAKRLGLRYDVEIIEAHHRTKQDAPSGTAKRLLDVAATARNQPTSAIPTHAVRAGDIVGDHTVLFAGPFERLELTHRAHSRDAFAIGALRAAQFLQDRSAGLYDMSHVLQHEGRP